MRRVIDRSVVDAPDLTAEKVAGHRVLRPVEIAAPACVQLRPPMTSDVVAESQARSDLLAKTEIEHVLLQFGPVRRDVLVSERMPMLRVKVVRDLPLVLHIEGDDVRTGFAE